MGKVIETYKNLPDRLLLQAENVEMDGWCNAARLMREAALVLKQLHDEGIIQLPLNDER